MKILVAFPFFVLICGNFLTMFSVSGDNLEASRKYKSSEEVVYVFSDVLKIDSSHLIIQGSNSGMAPSFCVCTPPSRVCGLLSHLSGLPFQV